MKNFLRLSYLKLFVNMASNINVDIGAGTVKMTPYATDTAAAATDSDVTSDR